ncbi:MAG: hypothetical protein WA658_22495, partial [Candidatus Acidiferrales bacterium]
SFVPMQGSAITYAISSSPQRRGCTADQPGFFASRPGTFFISPKQDGYKRHSPQPEAAGARQVAGSRAKPIE